VKPERVGNEVEGVTPVKPERVVINDTKPGRVEGQSVQEPKTYDKYLSHNKQSTFTKATGDEDYSKDQRSGFMGYYREIDYDEKVCACANP
jgi:hypothetical protein